MKIIFRWFNKLYLLTLLLLYPLGRLMPRDKNLWVFGSFRDAFNDNTKYLFYYVTANYPQIQAVWLSNNPKTIAFLEKKGLPVVKRNSWKGIKTGLRAGIYFYNSLLRDAGFYTSKGARLVNLWHGTPIKKIGYDNDVGDRRKVYHEKMGLIERILRPDWLIKPTWFLSSSKFAVHAIFKSAFRMPEEQFLPIGYPRTDHFFLPRPQLIQFINAKESLETMGIIETLQQYAKIHIYMPTYRDTGNDFLQETGIDLAQLNEVMKARNELFIFKLHVITNKPMFDLTAYSHLYSIPSTVDIYAILPFTDVLITDYSSIYFDYLLLDKEIILFIFDHHKYQTADRALYFEYGKEVDGAIARNFQEMLHLLAAGKSLKQGTEAGIKQLFWDDYRGEASAELVRILTAEHD